MFIFRRKKGMSLDNFYEHYENIHGPIARKLEGLVEYRQHPTRKPNRGDGAYLSKEITFDAVSVYTFENKEIAERAWNSNIGAILDEDTKRLIDVDTMLTLPITVREIYSKKQH
jgi:uncharacterized protein (TIGR02118 family)